MVSCCVPYCSSNSNKKRYKVNGCEHVSFHEFPVDLTLRERWLRAICRKDFVINDKSRSSVVCSKHFKREYLMQSKNGYRLKKDSVPSIFIGYPKYCLPDPTLECKSKEQKICNVSVASKGLDVSSSSIEAAHLLLNLKGDLPLPASNISFNSVNDKSRCKNIDVPASFELKCDSPASNISFNSINDKIRCKNTDVSASIATEYMRLSPRNNHSIISNVPLVPLVPKSDPEHTMKDIDSMARNTETLSSQLKNNDTNTLNQATNSNLCEEISACSLVENATSESYPQQNPTICLAQHVLPGPCAIKPNIQTINQYPQQNSLKSIYELSSVNECNSSPDPSSSKLCPTTDKPTILKISSTPSKDCPTPQCKNPEASFNCKKMKKLQAKALEIKRLKRQMARCNKKMQAMRSSYSTMKTKLEKFTKSIHHQNLEKLLILERENISSLKHTFILNQFKNAFRRVFRWPKKVLEECVYLHTTSPSQYRLIKERNLVTLPSLLTLKRYTRRKAGIVSLINSIPDADNSNKEIHYNTP